MKSLMLRALATALAGASALTMPIWPVIFAAVVWNDLCDEEKL